VRAAGIKGSLLDTSGSFWEAEIRRITVQGQPKQIVLEILSQKDPTQKRAGKVESSDRMPA
jgi:hypothetical protein